MSAEPRSVWTERGMPTLLTMSALGFSGFALLLPTAPLWVVRGGADEAGAGFVNGVLMLFTVIAQLAVGPALRRLGWRTTLILGMSLLGAPSLVHAATDALAPVLGLAALRGLGFGILTVCGVTAIAALIEPARRGRAIGAYGLAIALPQFFLIPAAPWLAETFGFTLVFALGASPVVAILPAAMLAGRLRPLPPRRTAEPHGNGLGRRLARPIGVLLVITAAGGAVLTFAPQMVQLGAEAAAALLGFTGAAAVCRWRFGAFADRYGPRRFMIPLLVLGAAGLVLIGFAVADETRFAALLAGAVLVGGSYGGLQNLTLVQAFTSAGSERAHTASTAWNIGFDTGTGIGAVLVGQLAAGASFPVALCAVAVLCLLAVPLALRDSRAADQHPPSRIR